MFQTSPKIENWAPNRILLVLLILFAVVAIGCGKNSKRGDRTSELPVNAGPALQDDLFEAEVNSTDSKTFANQTAQEVSQEPGVKPARLFLDDRYSSATGAVQEFTDERLHKSFTLLLLTMEPDIRARELMKYLRNVFTEEQKAQALDIALAEDYRFLRLRRRRAEVLENAYDGQDVGQELRKIQVETVRVSDEIRANIHNTVLTHEQLDAWTAQKKLDAETKQAEPK